ncbi:hypothetical protein BD626DRAFT_485050 [Schizophyllum amplum]|uniref:CVC domain-containing protein n=1 Tax=Schizophyllum amplum TaxID=97359 RepID=A0A550CQZ9_9AGAR|nr:hypothetical protein BD626DRAFT_485050 [Auriculariopsis ampla]
MCLPPLLIFNLVLAIFNPLFLILPRQYAGHILRPSHITRSTFTTQLTSTIRSTHTGGPPKRYTYLSSDIDTPPRSPPTLHSSHTLRSPLNMSVSDKRLKDTSPQELVRDLSLSAIGTAARLRELCVLRVEEASKGTTGEATEGSSDTPTDTPGLEDFLTSLWTEVLAIAQEDEAYHARLLELLAELKAQSNESTPWRVWGSPAALHELSLFGAQARDLLNAPKVILDGKPARITAADAPLLASDHAAASAPRTRAFTAARRRWLLLHRFLARTWAAGLWPCADFALWTMRDGLEYPAGHATYSKTPRALCVEAAAEWAVYAGAAMHGCREVMGPNGNAGWPGNAGSPGRGGERWKGVDGYDAGRWRLWKETCGAIAMEEGAARPYRFT